MTGIFDVTDNTCVDDQCCRNCMWWNHDLLDGKLKCQNYRSEKHEKKTDGSEWCWHWQKDKKHR